MGIRTTRSNRRLLCWGVAASATLMLGAALSAPNARADETNYLIDLARNGVTVYNPTLAIADGYRICLEAQQGWTWNQGALQLMRDNPRLDYDSAMTEARIAKLDLC